MTLPEITERLEVVKTAIRKMRNDRNMGAVYTTTFGLATTVLIKSRLNRDVEFVAVSSDYAYTVACVTLALGAAVAVSWWIKAQRVLTNLRDKQHDLEHEEVKQLILTRK